MFHPFSSTVSGCYRARLLAVCLSCPASITFPASLAVGDLFCFHVNQMRKAASWQWASGVCFTCFLQYKLILSWKRKQLYLFVCFFCLLVCPDKRWPDPIANGWVGGVGSLYIGSKPEFLRFCFPLVAHVFEMFFYETMGHHWLIGIWEIGSVPFLQASSLENSEPSRSCKVLLALTPPPGDTLVTFLILPPLSPPLFWSNVFLEPPDLSFGFRLILTAIHSCLCFVLAGI